MTTILLVDDSEVDRRLAAGLLRAKSDCHIEFAADGEQALEQLQRIKADLVLTDMQMPNMDGLQLVELIRSEYIGLPVILMTAHGSEALALRALNAGAASYVPKSQLSVKLLETVEDVLAISRAERNYDRLISYLGRTEFEFTIANDPAAIDPLIDLVHQLAAGMRFCDDTDGQRMSVALKEALLNALYRGNLELPAEQTTGEYSARPSEAVAARLVQPPYRDRCVHVRIQLSPREAVFVVRDEGPGFDVEATITAAAETLDVENRRGLMLMQAFMDEIRFNDRGNEVRMVKKCS